jgi:hypothetical protein
MRLVCSEDCIITQKSPNKVILCDLETLPIIYNEF